MWHGPRVQSFGYNNGGPAGEPDYVLDCRMIKNPYNPKWSDEDMRKMVLESPLAQEYIKRGVLYLIAEPTKTIAFGCSYGRHRSYVIAREVQHQLARHYGE